MEGVDCRIQEKRKKKKKEHAFMHEAKIRRELILNDMIY
jgi:hypothetical protein